MEIVLIGDAHGMIGRLQRIQGQVGSNMMSIQLGDLGCGFTHIPPMDKRHKFIRGNHDDPEIALAHPNYMGDYGKFKYDGRTLFYISGAASIDKDMRVPGVSWWEGEEMSWNQLKDVVDLYLKVKPEIVLSHECPREANREMLIPLLVGGEKWYFNEKLKLQDSRTCQAMQKMFDGHQPKLWVFGHYHRTCSFEINGTTFQCLGELDTRVLDCGTARFVG